MAGAQCDTLCTCIGLLCTSSGRSAVTSILTSLPGGRGDWTQSRAGRLDFRRRTYSEFREAYWDIRETYRETEVRSVTASERDESVSVGGGGQGQMAGEGAS